jgi:hypothetical protein
MYQKKDTALKFCFRSLILDLAHAPVIFPAGLATAVEYMRNTNPIKGSAWQYSEPGAKFQRGYQ